MPIFNQDETDSGDIFEQQRRRTRTNAAVDSRGTNFSRTSAQKGPGKNTGGALSQGAFVTDIKPARNPTKKAQRFASGMKASDPNKPRTSFFTSTGNVESSRIAQRQSQPGVVGRATQGINNRGQLRNYKGTITRGTGDNRETFGFDNQRKFDRAQAAVSKRNREVAAIRARQKKMGYKPGSFFDLKSADDLSFGEKVLVAGRTGLEPDEKFVRAGIQGFRAIGKGIVKGVRKTPSVIRATPAAARRGAASAAVGARAAGDVAKRTGKLAIAPAKGIAKHPFLAGGAALGGVGAYGVTQANKPQPGTERAVRQQFERKESFGNHILDAAHKNLKEGT